MSATTWFIIAIVGFSLSGIALVTAVFMFIKMDIPSIIGDLTGRTVAREIKEMRNTNMATGDKRFRPSKTNLDRGMLTEKVDDSSEGKSKGMAHQSKRLDKTTGELNVKRKNTKSGTVGLGQGSQAYVINEESTEVLSSNSTELLDDGATEVLSDNATEVLNETATEVLSSESTTVLSEGTTVLGSTEELKSSDNPDPVPFEIVQNVIVTHSDEVI